MSWYLWLGFILGIGWSLLQGTGKSWEGAFLPAYYKDGIWIWEAKGHKGGYTGTNFPRDTGVPSSTTKRLHEWDWKD